MGACRDIVGVIDERGRKEGYFWPLPAERSSRNKFKFVFRLSLTVAALFQSV